MAAETDVLAGLEGRQEALQARLREWVEISSCTADRIGVDRLGDLLASQLQELGFRIAEIVSGTWGRTVVARREGSGGHRLLLIGHLDTVHPAESGFEGLVEVAGDPSRLTGPGCADMKGGLVVMLEALRALAAAGELEGRQVVVVLASEEERGSPVSSEVIRGEATVADLCLVFEPGRVGEDGATTFVTGRRGFGRFRLTAHGRAAHAGVESDAGASAIRELALKVPVLEDLAAEHPGSSVTVGLFHGGSAANTVPESAWIEVDYRYADPESGLDLEDALLTAAGRHQVHDARGRPCVSTRLEDHVKRPPLLRTEAIGRMSDRIRSWGAELGLELREETRGGSSDAAIAADMGCPAVCGLGAVGGAFHTRDEWVLPASLVDRARLAALVMYRFWRL